MNFLTSCMIPCWQAGRCRSSARRVQPPNRWPGWRPPSDASKTARAFRPNPSPFKTLRLGPEARRALVPLDVADWASRQDRTGAPCERVPLIVDNSGESIVLAGCCPGSRTELSGPSVPVRRGQVKDRGACQTHQGPAGRQDDRTERCTRPTKSQVRRTRWKRVPTPPPRNGVNTPEQPRRAGVLVASERGYPKNALAKHGDRVNTPCAASPA